MELDQDFIELTPDQQRAYLNYLRIKRGGITRAMGTTARANAGSSLAGQAGFLGGFAGGAKATAMTPAAKFAPAVGLVTGLVGAFTGASTLGPATQRFIDNMYMSDEEASDLQQQALFARELHPIASTVGRILPEFATGALARKALVQAGKGLINLRKIGWRDLEPLEKSGIVSTAAGGALTGGIEGAQQVAQGEFRPAELAGAVALGSVVQYRPKIQKRIGMRDPFDEQPEPTVKRDLYYNQSTGEVMRRSDFEKSTELTDRGWEKRPHIDFPDLTKPERLEQQLTREAKILKDLGLQTEPSVEVYLDKKGNVKRKVTDRANLPEGQDTILSQSDIQDAAQTRRFGPLWVARDRATREANWAAFERSQLEELQDLSTQSELSQVEAGQGLSETPSLDSLKKGPAFRFKRQLDQATEPTTQAEDIDLEVRQKVHGDRFQAETTEPTTIKPSEVEEGKQQAARAGVDVAEAPFGIPGGARGMADLGNRVTVVDPKKATSDTIYHEVAHHTINDLLNSKYAPDQKLAKRLIDLLSEEGYAQAQGVFSAKRSAELKDRGMLQKFMDWLDDVEAYWKVQHGEPTLDNMMRYLENRRRYGRTFQANPDLNPALAGVEEAAPRTRIPAEDYRKKLESYTRLEQRISDLNKQNKPDLAAKLHPELQRRKAELLEQPPGTPEGYRFQAAKNSDDVLEPDFFADALNEIILSIPTGAAKLSRAFPGLRKQVESESFQRWFGEADESLRASDGSPLMLYHGTPSAQDFNTFRPFSHFGSTPEQASTRVDSFIQKEAYLKEKLENPQTDASDKNWAKLSLENLDLDGGSAARIYPVFSNAKKILRVSDDGANNLDWFLLDVRSHSALEIANDPGFELGGALHRRSSLNEAYKYLQEKHGVEGLVYKNSYEGSGDSFVIFDSAKNIKSAVGNFGHFTDLRDIRFQGGAGASPTVKPMTRLDVNPIRDDLDPKVQAALMADKYNDFVPGWFFKKAAAEIDQLRFLGETPESRRVANYAADAFTRMERMKTRFIGKYNEGWLMEHLKYKITPDEARLLSRYSWEKRHHGKSDLEAEVMANPRFVAAIENNRNFLRDAQIEKNETGPMVLVNGKLRKAGLDPDYYADMLDHEVRNVLTNRKVSPEGRDLRQKLIDHYTMKGDDDPVKAVDDYIEALGWSSGLDDTASAKFNALRKAEGYGLPYDLTQRSMTLAMPQYFYRWSSDMAFFKAVENDPVMRGILHLKDQTGRKNWAQELTDGTWISGNNPIVGSQAGDLFAVYIRAMTNTEKTTKAFSRIASSVWLGLRTGLVDFMSSFLHALPYVPLTQVPKILKSFQGFQDAWKASHLAGVNRHRINALEFGERKGTFYIDQLEGLADGFSKWGGRQAIEKFTRGSQFWIGRAVAGTMLELPVGHSKAADRFFRILGQDIPELDKIRGSGKYDPKVIDEIAAQWVERNQGTYDLRGLPKEAQQGIWAPWLSLGRWNIEKMNVMYKDVWLPAVYENDLAPLLKVTAGAVIGGKLIEEAATMLTGKRRSIPTVEESMAKGDPVDTMMSLAALVNYMGYFGVLSQFVTDAIGSFYFKTFDPQGILVFPAMESLHDSVFKNTLNLVKAWPEAEPTQKLTILSDYLQRLVTENVQTARIVLAHTFDKDKTEASQMQRRLRMFKALEGSNEGIMTRFMVDLENAPQRSFRGERNPDKIEGRLPGALSKAVRKGRGRVDLTAHQLTALHTDTEKILPSVNTPEGVQELLRFKDFIEKAYGPEAFQKVIQRALQNEELSEYKKNLVMQAIMDNPVSIGQDMNELNRRFYSKP